MKTIFKNFFFILNRFKTSSILNILGLSVAFAVFGVVVIQSIYDFSFDKQFQKSDSIFYFNYYKTGSSGTTGLNISTPLAKQLDETFPEIKNYCLFEWYADVQFDLKHADGTITSFKEWEVKTTPGFLEMFTPEIIAGDPVQALTMPGKVMITKTLSEKIFGKENPVGKPLYYHYSPTPLTVVAVCEDFPLNSSIKNGVYVFLPDDNRENFNYKGYFEVLPGVVTELEKKMNNELFSVEEKKIMGENPDELVHFRLTPLTRLHLYFPAYGQGNINTTWSLLVIGIITLLIAFVNFINFSIAMAPARVRSLSIQKVLGASVHRLRFVVASEAAVFSCIAFVLSLFWILLLKSSPVNEFFLADLTISLNIVPLILIGLVLILIAFLLGLYPAYYVTSFQPVVALNGSFLSSARSSRLRNVLITFQFTMAIMLIIISSFIKIQHDYMVNYPWGMQKENVIYLQAWDLRDKGDMKVFSQELKKEPGVIDFTGAHALPGNVGMEWSRDYQDKMISFVAWPVHPNFLDFFGIPVIEGEHFPENDSTFQVIFNESFVQKYQLNNISGKVIYGMEDQPGVVRGIAQNINFESLHQYIRPMAFLIMNDRWINWMFVKISGTNTAQTLAHIEDTWRKFSDEPLNISFLDTRLNNLYKSENNLALLITIFGIIAVVIAIMGVYGLIMFNAKYKAKEIAVRKINGSSEKEIIFLLNRSVFMQLIIAFILASSISYFIVTRWLENFAYKTPVYWWVFALAGLLVFIITLLTVSMQSYRAAVANPTEALKD